MDRLVTLSKIIGALGPIKGEKSLQKLIYLTQCYGDKLGYQFNWNNYGPISFRLEKDIQEIRTLGLISISYDNDIPVYVGVDQSNQLTAFWRERLQQESIPPNSQRVIDFINSLGDQRTDPLFLELIASMDYLQRHEESDPVLRYQPDPRCDDELLHIAKSTLQQLQYQS